MAAGARATDLQRVIAFRNRLVAFVDYVGENARLRRLAPQDVQGDTSQEQAWLAQEYGRVYRVIQPYGIAQMTQFGGIASTDVVRDTIGSLGRPSYGAMAGMAIQHLDMVIGRMRADVEDQADTSPRSSDALYRYTSLAYWLGRLLALVRWFFFTGRGRVVTVIGAVVLAIIGGIVSGAAQAWFEGFFR